MSEPTLKPDQLAALAATIADEFERSARMRRIVPAEVPMPGASYGIAIPKVESLAAPPPSGLTIGAIELEPPITLSVELQFVVQHLDDTDNISMLARAAAKRIAAVEDRLIAYGGALSPPIPGDIVIGDVRVQGLKPTTAGLFFPKTLPPALPPPLLVEDLLGTFQQARGRLETAAPPGPYSGPYAAAFAKAGWMEFLLSPLAKSIEGVIGSNRLASVPGDDPKIDLAAQNLYPHVVLFSSETLVCDLVRVSMPTGSMRGFAANGALRYVIDEQFLLRVKDPTGFARAWLDLTAVRYFI
jgi:hypothetical protein